MLSCKIILLLIFVNLFQYCVTSEVDYSIEEKEIANESVVSMKKPKSPTLNVPEFDDGRQFETSDEPQAKTFESSPENLEILEQSSFFDTSLNDKDPGTGSYETYGRHKRSTLDDVDAHALATLNRQTGLEMSTDEYTQLSEKFQDFLKQESSLNQQRSGRGLLQARTSLSITVNAPHFFYQEDSGPALMIPNPVQIEAPSGIEYVLIESLNILDTNHEILALSSFTQTAVASVGERNVTFDYVITPTYTFDNAGVLNLTGLLSVHEYELAISTLTYDNTAEEPIAQFRGLNIEIHDATSTANAPIYFTLQNVNDSPFFGTQPAVITIQEDNLLYAPISSSSIPFLGNSISDNDFGSELAIAVLGADNSNGLWRYLGPSNSLVTIQDGVRDSSGNILRNTSLSQTCVVLKEQYLGYFPNANFVGNTTITVVAWDKTGTSSSLSNGDFANVTWSAGGDPFSPDMATVTVVVAPVNDAPHVTLTSSPPTIQLTTMYEDSDGGNGVKLIKLIEACDDIDRLYDSSILNLGVAITGLDNSGTWQRTADNGTTWVNIVATSVLLGSNGDTESDAIRLVPNLNFVGEASLTYRCWDFTIGNNGDEGVDASYTGPTGAFSQQEITGTVVVTNVNDSPYFEPGIASVDLPVYTISNMTNELGTLVNDLVKDVYRDIDVPVNPGIAVISTESNFGEFQYKCEGNSVEWYSFYSANGAGYAAYEPVSIELATLLSSTCRIRFIPGTDFTSAIQTQLKIIPWDSSDALPAGSFRVNATFVTGGAFGQTSISVVTSVVAIETPIITGSQVEIQFTEKTSPVAAFSDIALSKMTSSRGISATVSITNALDVESEQLLIGSGFGYVDEAQLISVTGLSVTWNAHRTQVTLSGNATEDFYVAALRSVSYQHLSENPTASFGTTGLRRLDAVVTDILGTSSLVFSRNLRINAVNDPPRVNSTFASWPIVEFRRGSDPISLYSSVNFTFSDPDETSPSSVLISLNSVYDIYNEMFSIPASFQRSFYVNESYHYIKVVRTSSQYNATSGVFSFSVLNPDANFDDYSAAMREISYSNTADPPDFRHREVSMFAIDSANAASSTTNIIINIVEANGSAVIDLPPGNLPASPTIQHIVAYPATTASILRTTELHTDAKLSSGDRIEIIFDRDTSMPPFGYYDTTDPIASAGKILHKHEILELFSFTNPLVVESIDGYTGRWKNAKTFEITVIREGYPQLPVQIGSWITTPKQACDGTLTTSTQYCIRDVTGLSKASQAPSPPLEGNWGLNVPYVTDIVVQKSLMSSGVEYVTEGTIGDVLLRPAMSKTQLDRICVLTFVDVFGTDIGNQFPGLSAAIAQCQNSYVAEWDVSLDKTDRVPTVTTLTLTFHTTGQDYPVSEVANYLTTNYKRSGMIEVVAQDTGVSKSALETYTVIGRSNTNVYVEQNDSLTPSLTSYSIARQDSLPISNGDITVHVGDVITLQFDRNTNQPNVSTQTNLDKVLSLNGAFQGSYVGNWINKSTLSIVITSINVTVSTLSFSFNGNRLADGSPVTDSVASNLHCVGSSVCVDNDFSVGICDTTLLSCRAHGTFTVSHTVLPDIVVVTLPTNNVVTQAGLDWWWLLLVGLILLFCIIIIIFLLRKRKKQKKDQKVNDTYDEYRSIPTESTNGIITPDILAWRKQNTHNRNYSPSNKYRRKSRANGSPFNGRVAPSPIYSVSSTLSRDVAGGNAVNSEIKIDGQDRAVQVSSAKHVSQPASASSVSIPMHVELIENSSYRNNEQKVMEILNHKILEGSANLADTVFGEHPLGGDMEQNHNATAPKDDSVTDINTALHELPSLKRGLSRATSINGQSGTPGDVQVKSASLPMSARPQSSIFHTRRTASVTDESSYVPSLISSLNSTPRYDSKPSTVGDWSDTPRNNSGHQHRASISGLPMTWYVAGGNDDTLPDIVSLAQSRRTTSNGRSALDKSEVIWE